MSEPIPESIPTSMDPRSKRPAKRIRTENMTPADAQAVTVSKLFANPEQEIKIFDPNAPKKGVRNAPEVVLNVQGSSAGAGSGEFHVYKATRRKEYERLRQMDEAVEKERDEERFEREKREREERDAEKTRRNREKREKKNKKKGGKAGGGGNSGKDDDDKVTGGGEGKREGGVKARIESGSGGGGKGEEGVGDEEGQVEVVGVVIHDDDE